MSRNGMSFHAARLYVAASRSEPNEEREKKLGILVSIGRSGRSVEVEEGSVPRLRLLRVRHRIISGIEHKAGLGREVHSRWPEDIDQPGRTLAHVLTRVYHPRGNNENRRAVVISLMLVPAPACLVRRPRISEMMHERAFQAQRHLLEILVRMGAEFSLVAARRPWHKDVDHQICRAEQAHLQRTWVGAR